MNLRANYILDTDNINVDRENFALVGLREGGAKGV